MKLSVSAYRAQASAHKKILNSSYQMLLNYGATCTTSQSQQQTSSLALPCVKVGNTDFLTNHILLLLWSLLKGLLQNCACQLRFFYLSACQSVLLSTCRKSRTEGMQLNLLLRRFDNFLFTDASFGSN